MLLLFYTISSIYYSIHVKALVISVYTMVFLGTSFVKKYFVKKYQISISPFLIANSTNPAVLRAVVF